ncbi:MAG: ankyrin repeat domain-containing protein [Candidatus Micrarchaeia archaeon]
MRYIDEELLEAVKSGNLDKVIELINLGADANVVDKDGRTPLHWASFWGHTEIVSYLLRVAPDNAKVKDNYGWIPLHYTFFNSCTKTISLFLTVAPNIVNIKNNIGEKPLYKTIVDNKPKTIQTLFTSISIKLETEMQEISKKYIKKKYLF